MIKIVIADDQELVRESLKIVLNTMEDMEVIGTADNGLDLIHFLEKNPADIILMDIRMPTMDGILATKIIKQKYPETKIIILTTFDDEEYVMNGLKYGASGYLLKGISIPELAAAIHKVMLGEAMLNTDIVTKVVKLFNQSSMNNDSNDEPDKKNQEYYVEFDESGFSCMNRTERNICRLLGRGMSNKEIAATLNLSEGSIRNNLSNALSKLALRDRTQLAIWSVQIGLAYQDLEADS